MADQTITYRDAIRKGLKTALQSDSKVFLLGEDVGMYGGAFAASKGLLQEFGQDRIMDVPLSEAGFTGAAIGAAIAGLKPVVEIMTVNFSLLALDQIINNAATLRHMSAGQISVPIVFRISCGPGRQLASQHSHSWEPMFAMIPGLHVISAGTHEDAEGMLPLALLKNDPVVIFEYTSLLNSESDLENHIPTNINRAVLRVKGSHLSIITYGTCVSKSLEAAAKLSEEGISVEVMDLRVLRPLDKNSILETARKTGKVLFVEDAWGTNSIGSEVAKLLYQECFFELETPMDHLSGVEVPTPYPLHLEKSCTPSVAQIIERSKILKGNG